MKRTTFLLLVMTMASVTVYAQQAGVSLKDTLLWMHNFAADNGSQDTGQSSIDNQSCTLGSPNCQPRHDVSTFESQACSATITWSITVSNEDIGTYIYRVSLKDLDPHSVVWVKDPLSAGSTTPPFENAVHVDTTNRAKKIVGILTPGPGETWDKALDEPQTWVELVFDSGDHAKRFVEAFKHAIELCGGKPSAL